MEKRKVSRSLYNHAGNPKERPGGKRGACGEEQPRRKKGSRRVCLAGKERGKELTDRGANISSLSDPYEERAERD